MKNSMDNELYQYLSRLHQYIKAQNKVILKLTKDLKEIQNDINQLKANPTKIEYKFDQLKVEKLSGTLNIGMSPKLNDNLENVSIDAIEDGQINDASGKFSDEKEQIYKRLEDYLNRDGYSLIDSIAKKHNYPIEKSFKKIMIDDIKGQLTKKIDTYLNQLDNENEINEKAINMIEEKIKDEIIKAIDNFVDNFPGKGNNA